MTQDRLTRAVAMALMGVVALVTAVRYAQPILDGDLFWHMAYARQMLARWSLVLDHAAFSWTPASNLMIYCAWAGELVLYALWEILGPASLFALRYLVILAVAALCWTHARRVGLADSPLTPAVLLVLVLGSHAGSLIKPELFSLLFMSLVVWAYFQARRAAAAGDDARRWLYLVPLVVLIWANTHGGFILAAPFLAMTAAGEALNARLSPGLALPPRAFRQMLIAWGLSGAATIFTPYGIRYPAQLVADYAFGRTPRPDVAWNDAHLSILGTSGNAWHFGSLMLAMLAVLGPLVVRAAATGARDARVDWAIVLANLAYIPLYAVYARATYFWPAVFAHSAICLAGVLRERALAASAVPRPARRRRVRRGRTHRVRYAVAAASAVLVLGLGGGALHAAAYQPWHGSWLGFGIGNPVVEAEFLARHRLGPRMYNIFDSGGYLLWRLGPDYQVMTDSRSFPYLAWFDEQYRFTMGQSFEAFLAAYPADLAVIDLLKQRAVRNFLRAPDWRLVFYGPTAAVFVRGAQALPPEARDFAPDRFRDLRNADTAARVFDFAASVGDFPTAWAVLAQLETRLRDRVDPKALRAAVKYREAHRALRRAEHRLAQDLFTESLRDKVPGDRDRLIQIFLARLDSLTAQGLAMEAGSYVAALRRLAAPEA